MFFAFLSPYRNRCEFIHDARIGGDYEPVMQVKPCGKEMENPALVHILDLFAKKSRSLRKGYSSEVLIIV
jgi:hypothetical protein